MIPKLWQITLPILKYISDGKVHDQRKFLDLLSNEFNLTNEERNRLKPSGGETILKNRLGWAVFYLKKAGLLDKKKAFVTITDDGKKILEQNLTHIDRKVLLSISRYQEYMGRIAQKQSGQEEDETSEQSPEDMMGSGYRSIRSSVEVELLEKINNNTPEFFESLVLDLIQKMGYGIEHQVVGRTGDGGIDGIIKEDKLGLDEIYFQAKRWKGNVPIHQVRDFAGSLTGTKSSKGIFITTSDFTKDAYDFVKGGRYGTLVLINGEQLVRYMYDYDLGVRVAQTYAIKKIDEDYFSE